MTASPWKDGLTVNQVAEQVGVSRFTVLNRIDDWKAGRPGGLPAVNVGGEGTGKRWRVDPEALEQWLQSRRVAA